MHPMILPLVATFTMSMSMSSRNILVTGGNTGIGLALCRQLAVDHVDKCDKVYMGARSKERGDAGLQSILNVHPNVAHRIEVLIMDVTNDESVNAAAKQLQSVSLYALVNNAGVGFNTCNDGSIDTLLQTNFYGPKRVTDAFLPLLNPQIGRIVNVSSGAASMWLRNESPAQQQIFTSSTTTWDELDHTVKLSCSTAASRGGGYGISKAGLTAYTIQCATMYPNILITSLSPGFIETKMTSGYGAKLSPEQGTISLMKCLFGNDVVSGYYYGSDGLRSPLTVARDPGTPEYTGEVNPDPRKYNL